MKKEDAFIKNEGTFNKRLVYLLSVFGLRGYPNICL